MFNSHLSYGLVGWGNARYSYIDKIRSLQKRALKAIAFSHKENNIDIKNIHYNLQILNIDRHLPVQLSSLMWNYDHDTLPLSLRVHFKKANLLHNYITRVTSKGWLTLW